MNASGDPNEPATVAEEALFEALPAPRRVRRPNRLVRLWRQVGGGSLTLSLVIHAGLLFAAGVVVVVTQMQEPQIDFLPGGGTQQGAQASNELAHQVQQKKRSTLTKKMPIKKIVTTSMNAALVLPDAPLNALDVPDLASLIGTGSLRNGGGFGKSGAGGGFGNGFGSGGLGGITFKPITMFGRELKDSRKIAVVMDVSRSMTRYLPIVAKELDKVARGSPLILYFGCGLRKPPREIDDKVRKVGTEEFNKFWYYWEGRQDMRMLRTEYPGLKYEPGQPMPQDAIYQQMVKRPNTYFIDFNGITYTSPALMCKEVMEADSLYWFADFQDAVDVAHLEEVVKKLKYRKQKLYIHASIRGRSFELVRDKLVLPLGGEVIETKAE
ncbi:MAG: hypothetical protein U0984_17895 [Prosthecobacter sp.]|nr:hypothetical protein [Prosthecobacter sp.]